MRGSAGGGCVLGQWWCVLRRHTDFHTRSCIASYWSLLFVIIADFRVGVAMGEHALLCQVAGRNQVAARELVKITVLFPPGVHHRSVIILGISPPRATWRKHSDTHGDTNTSMLHHSLVRSIDVPHTCRQESLLLRTVQNRRSQGTSLNTFTVFSAPSFPSSCSLSSSLSAPLSGSCCSRCSCC